MRILVCGGRDMSRLDVRNWLERNARDEIAHAPGCHAGLAVEALINGGARGADQGAVDWARANGVRVAVFNADWAKHGKAAGPIRNQRMIDEGKPDVVIAFPGGRGTADMVFRAEAAGIPIIAARPR
jgi:hypothetical protein